MALTVVAFLCAFDTFFSYRFAPLHAKPDFSPYCLAYPASSTRAAQNVSCGQIEAGFAYLKPESLETGNDTG
jgi:hypothetical protein